MYLLSYLTTHPTYEWPFLSGWFVCGLHFTYWPQPQLSSLFALIKAQHDGANQRASYLVNLSSAGWRKVVTSGFLDLNLPTCQHITPTFERATKRWKGSRHHSLSNETARPTVSLECHFWNCVGLCCVATPSSTTDYSSESFARYNKNYSGVKLHWNTLKDRDRVGHFNSDHGITSWWQSEAKFQCS